MCATLMLLLQKPAKIDDASNAACGAVGASTASSPMWVKSRVEESGLEQPMFGSPSTIRKVNQSPALKEDSPTKYRTPPSTPFQPGFYKPPPLEDPQLNPFPLSPKVARKIEKSSESIDSSSSSGRKMRRRKKRSEAQRHADDATDSDNDYEDAVTEV